MSSFVKIKNTKIELSGAKRSAPADNNFTSKCRFNKRIAVSFISDQFNFPGELSLYPLSHFFTEINIQSFSIRSGEEFYEYRQCCTYHYIVSFY